MGELSGLQDDIEGCRPVKDRLIQSVQIMIRTPQKLKKNFVHLKGIFDSNQYVNNIGGASKEEYDEIRSKLIEIYNGIDDIIRACASAGKILPFRPFVRSAMRTLAKERIFLEEKIFDLQFGGQDDFSVAMDRIAEGIDKSCLDPKKMASFGSIL
jgi:hypothetical protein